MNNVVSTENKEQIYSVTIKNWIMRVRRNIKNCKRVFFNLSIGKRLLLGFSYMGIIAILFFAVGLTGMLSLESKIKQFSKDAYKMETTALNAEVALMDMQNYIYKAMQTDKENVSLTLAEKAEAEYVDFLAHLETIYTSDSSVKSVTPEMKVELQNELKKADRYHTKFNACIAKKDVAGAFEIYKNDYAPILGSISTVLDSIYTSAGQYAGMYVAKSSMQTIISCVVFLLLAIIGLASCFFAAKVTSKSIVEPIQEIEKAVNDISKGNLDIHLEYRSKEELGALSHAVRKTTTFLKEYIENITDVLERLEKKDMKVQVTTEYVGSFAPIKKSLTEIIKFYHEIVSVLKDTSTEVSTGALQLADLSQGITKDANTQTESIQALVEQMNGISNEIEQNAEHVINAQVLAQKSKATAQKGNLQMDRLSEAVERINNDSKEIASINQLIKNIAAQTHLLSLNASIEAARAGAEGYGFAVVADEIRKLSNQTKEAAHTVNELIDTNLQSIIEGNEIAQATAKQLKAVEEYSTQTNGLIASISETSQNQTEKIKEALIFLMEIAGIANENLAVAEESYATSTEFLNQSDVLQNKLKEFIS